MSVVSEGASPVPVPGPRQATAIVPALVSDDAVGQLPISVLLTNDQFDQVPAVRLLS
ncbi:MAG: hypothetical protein M3O28_00050 [Actinomycetota bacterium]|nr:hypothetical protein [Actinomycetota bacterium]